MDTFKKVIKSFYQKTVVGYGSISLLTVGGERLFSLFAFKCPCSSQNLTYGLVFLFVPALVLLILSILVNSWTWRCLTGCFYNPKRLCPNGNIFYCLCIFGKITAGALVAPTTWLAVTLIIGTSYECTLSGWENEYYRTYLCQNKPLWCKEDVYKVPCGRSRMNVSDNRDVLQILRVQSQVMGLKWSLVAHQE
ncbi:calcium homeostasis modulator protein 5-like [Protopterus annectens]|uniref:calcium homeostasis modulator protein 5-like n=1 Tax=Protopterus annectens TaxID=7888 RepID=UPI001CFA9CEB|nr:calcium homeostasis modulator protein 5-like [Protopterus annectens]